MLKFIGLFIGRTLFFFFFFYILGFLFFCVYIRNLKTIPLHIHTKAIVVLTGGKNRLSEAKKVFDEQMPKPLLHVSGTNFYSLKEMMQDLHHIPYLSIDKALNTKENLASIKQWSIDHRISSMRLVTSDYHFPRVFLLSDFPKDVAVIPHPVRELDALFIDYPFLQYQEYYQRLIREYLKFSFAALEKLFSAL